jgi:hypothetical protein
MRTKPLSEALLNAAATNGLYHNWKRAEIAAIYCMNLQAAALRLNEESTVRAIQSLTELKGSAPLQFSLTYGIAESEIVRLENCTNTWRDGACRSATVGRA